MSYALNRLLTPETMREHRARWFVYAGGGHTGTTRQKIPHTAAMRGFWPGYDVTCSCGWESRTGGATRNSVESDLWDHRHAEQCEKSSETETGA